MYTQVGLAGEGSKQVGSGATGVQREGQAGRPRRGGGILVAHLPGNPDSQRDSKEIHGPPGWKFTCRAGR